MLKQLFNYTVWTFFVAAGGLLLTLYANQNKLVYVPNMPPNSRTELLDPRQFQIRHYEDVTLSTPDGEQLFCWLFKQTGTATTAPTIVFFHGNAGNIGIRLPNVKEFLRFGCNVFIIDYRGYGKSSGEPTEPGLKVDAETVINHLHTRRDISPEKLVLFGRSLGGAVAVYLGSRFSDKIHAIVLENTFTSVPEMTRVVLPHLGFMFPLFSFLCTNRWESGEEIKSFTKPTLFLSGEKDELVPEWMMQKLFQNCGSSKKKFKSFPEGDHMSTWTQPHYWETFTEFLNSLK